MSADIDPIILGHNPFFGVNHLSRQHGAEREATFEDASAIVNMMRTASALGVSAMMMSTHPRAASVAALIRGDRTFRDSWSFYPLLPYITKYVRQANERGLLNIVLDQLKQTGWSQRLGMVARGGLGVLTRDYRQVLNTLIELELACFSDLQVKAVFLHDVLTDLALALDIPEVLAVHSATVGKRFGARGGFATKNLPLLIERFEKYGFERPLVLAQINKVGFGMNPSRGECEAVLGRANVDIVAMGTLASGYLRPTEAFEYVFAQPSVRSVVVGVSTSAHAAETFAAARHAGSVAGK